MLGTCLRLSMCLNPSPKSTTLKHSGESILEPASNWFSRDISWDLKHVLKCPARQGPRSHWVSWVSVSPFLIKFHFYSRKKKSHKQLIRAFSVFWSAWNRGHVQPVIKHHLMASKSHIFVSKMYFIRFLSSMLAASWFHLLQANLSVDGGQSSISACSGPQSLCFTQHRSCFCRVLGRWHPHPHSTHAKWGEE